MKIIYCALILSLLALFSCKKKDLDFVIKGNIKSATTAAGIENAEIKVYTYTVGNGVKSLQESLSTNSSGDYEFSLERSKFETLLIEINTEKYFKQEIEVPFDQLTTEEDNVYNRDLSPQSWVAFVLKNEAPKSNSDVLKIQKVSGKTNCDDCCPNQTTFYNGEIDTTVYCPNDGESYLKFYWWAEGESTMNGVDSIYTTSFDTLTHYINY